MALLADCSLSCLHRSCPGGAGPMERHLTIPTNSRIMAKDHDFAFFIEFFLTSAVLVLSEVIGRISNPPSSPCSMRLGRLLTLYVATFC